MRAIDGAHGEGGGQLLRTACALSALTGEAVRVFDIRARRAPPGLAPQHLTAVKAVAALCGAEVEGLAVRAPEVVFRPGRLRGGEFRFDVGTAGSITLVLQAVLPVAFACGENVTLRLIGGTDVKAAPPLDYFRFVFLPLLERMGFKAKIELIRRGYYPRGGGEVGVEVEPGRPRPLRLDAPGALEEIRGVAHAANLPAHVAERMRRTAEEILCAYPRVRIEPQVLGREQAIGSGGAIVAWARTEHTILGGSEVAQRGVPAERIAQSAAESLRAEIESGATLDLHAADQILIYAALAPGASSFLARTWSSHAQTTAWLLEQFLPVRIRAPAHDALTRVEIAPE
ncbi:MAG: RNA 3'-terminal-phosphate cyclase [Candidatus Muproteobacteria bacterium RBG_16_65_34]|uniref:RNA 3'-terminal phosphate cyclase n=1 Tax=Candidatus Muproteobacteria bacterium RBG_16_65_34 TaxID=1817760 RepID=A0A1F6TUQ9_9PROT|nr:MAG: RNA 3'-terminal-phosphate cyclase [Candidatus Muproteobacteria bacterium RBG_16_65_34]